MVVVGSQTSAESAAQLVIRDLSVSYILEQGATVSALEQIALQIAPGEILGVLGESGSGKSTLASAILGLLPKNTSTSGSVQFNGQELLGCPASTMRLIRGARIAMIHQDPGLALNPVLRAGTQVEEVIRAHKESSKADRINLAREALAAARIQDVDRTYRSYPHQLSGGERLRVTIAQAIACGPKLIIADEPTSSLDPTIQSEVLTSLSDLSRDSGTAMLFITHDPAILARLAQRVIVMQRGRIIEEGKISDVFSRPQHSYVRELIGLIPQSLGARA